MNAVGTRIRDGRVTRQFRNTHAEPDRQAAEPSAANTPYWLLWPAGTVAFVLCIVAFVLWGIGGPGTLFDMIVVLCT